MEFSSVKAKYGKFHTFLSILTASHISLPFNISFNPQEFVLATNLTTAGSAEEKLRWAFKLYDKDESGQFCCFTTLPLLQAQLVGNVASKKDLCKKVLSGKFLIRKSFRLH